MSETPLGFSLLSRNGQPQIPLNPTPHNRQTSETCSLSEVPRRALNLLCSRNLVTNTLLTRTPAPRPVPPHARQRDTTTWGTAVERPAARKLVLKAKWFLGQVLGPKPKTLNRIHMDSELNNAVEPLHVFGPRAACPGKCGAFWIGVQGLGFWLYSKS